MSTGLGFLCPFSEGSKDRGSVRTMLPGGGRASVQVAGGSQVINTAAKTSVEIPPHEL